MNPITATHTTWAVDSISWAPLSDCVVLSVTTADGQSVRVQITPHTLSVWLRLIALRKLALEAEEKADNETRIARNWTAGDTESPLPPGSDIPY